MSWTVVAIVAIVAILLIAFGAMSSWEKVEMHRIDVLGRYMKEDAKRGAFGNAMRGLFGFDPDNEEDEDEIEESESED